MSEERKCPACTECRGRKLRCIPGREREDGCHRCVRLGKQCQIPEGKRRKRETRLVRGRVDRLQSSYAEILVLLKQQVQIPPSLATTTSQPLFTTAPEPAQSQSQPHGPGSQNASPSFFPAAVDADTLHHRDCQDLINDYHRMSKAPNFAFVVIPESCHAASLIKERPMLAQAIFIVTSWKNPARQNTLRTNYLKEFGNRYFSRSERSLDLLQSLIVYFGWCHWYSPGTTFRAYRLATIIVNLTIELGISEGPTNARHRQFFVNGEPRLSPQNEATSSKFWSYEARRLFVAAYVCSTLCCRAARRPALLSFTQYLQDCATSLAAEPQYSSDASLIHQVGTLRLAEQTASLFTHGSEEGFSQVSDDKLQILVKALVRQVDEWRALLPSGATQSGCPLWSHHIARAFIHEIGLDGVSPGQSLSVARAAIIYECYTASMKALADISESSLNQMVLWSILDWRQLNFVVMLCTKSSIVLDLAHGSPESSSRAIWLTKCLETLCLRARDLHGPAMTGAPQGVGQDHFLIRLAAQWTKVKNFYRKCVEKNMSQMRPVTTVSCQPLIQQCPRSIDVPFDVDFFNEMY